MRKTIKILLFIALAALYVGLVRAIGHDAGVSIAFLGFIGKAISSVGKIAGKVIGIGGSGGTNPAAPVQISTPTDPNLTKLIDSQNALIQLQAAKEADKIFGLPKWLAIGGGLAVLGVGAYFLLRHRHG